MIKYRIKMSLDDQFSSADDDAAEEYADEIADIISENTGIEKRNIDWELINEGEE